MKHPVQIIRPINLFIIAITMAVVLFKYKDELNENYLLHSILLIIPAILTAAAGYIINDIFDIETDKINKPEKCIIGVNLSKKNALVIYFSLSAVSLIVSFLFSKQYLIFNLCMSVVLFLYSYQLKGTPLLGNIIVSLCSAAVIACCVLLISFDTKAAVFNFTGYVIFAFFISLIREIVKDIQDIEGDKLAGLQTYPILTGVKGAKIMIYLFAAIEIIFCGVYSFLSWGFDMYSSSVIMGLITLSLIYFINLISRSKVKEDYSKASALLKLMMLAGVINLIFA